MEENKKYQEQMLRMMKLQTAFQAAILVLLIVTAAVVMISCLKVNALVSQVDAAAVSEAVSRLKEIDMDGINRTISSMQAVSQNLKNIDVNGINDVMDALTGAADTLGQLDAAKLNELIKSLEASAQQMQKTMEFFGRFVR